MDVFHINCSNSTKSRKASECIVSSNLYLTKDKVFGQKRMGFWLEGYYKTFLMSEKLDPIFSKSICNPLKNTNSFHATALSAPPENIRKPLVFCYVQGVERDTSGLKWVKICYEDIFGIYNLFEDITKWCCKKIILY